MAEHTPAPWFLSGIRFRMNGGEWQSINRYDEAGKFDQNIALVGYDSRTGEGFADARFIVRACNAHHQLVDALEELNAALDDGLCNSGTPGFNSGRLGRAQDAARAALAFVREQER